MSVLFWNLSCLFEYLKAVLPHFTSLKPAEETTVPVHQKYHYEFLTGLSFVSGWAGDSTSFCTSLQRWVHSNKLNKGSLYSSDVCLILCSFIDLTFLSFNELLALRTAFVIQCIAVGALYICLCPCSLEIWLIYKHHSVTFHQFINELKHIKY